MEQERNDLLLNDLFEAHGGFDNLINEMKDLGISFPYEDTIRIEEASYTNAYNAISRMNEYTTEYNYLYEENGEYFDHEAGIILKGVLLYGVTIIALKLFSKVLSAQKINEMVYLIVGMLLGSINTGMIFNNLNNFRNGTKESRDLLNRLATLRENYKEDYNTAMNEIDCLFSLNRNLWKELDSYKAKVLLKEKA